MVTNPLVLRRVGIDVLFVLLVFVFVLFLDMGWVAAVITVLVLVGGVSRSRPGNGSDSPDRVRVECR